MSDAPRKIAVVTGASSGIGAATARRLAADGYQVVLAARRLDRLQDLAAEIDGVAVQCDITDQADVDALAAQFPTIHMLVNNAGGAHGKTTVMESDEGQWRTMWETNVLGTMRVCRALVPALIASGDGLIVTITSVAAFETYEGGSGYTSAKHAESALAMTLRKELLGEPVRLTEIQPGLVETEFSLVRFGGDQAAADAVYQGMTPLQADDIARTISFVAAQPSHVNLDTILIRARDQYANDHVLRRR